MHLLLVEDDTRLARALVRLLRDDRHVVDVAGDGSSAMDLVDTADGSLDAMILDIGLPDISGLEVARRIRATGSNLAILMLTARDAIGDRVAGLDAGADDYLVKPFAYDELALSRQEFALLECLLRNPGRVLSRDELLDRAWPVGAALTPNSVEVYIHYLRTKLGHEGTRIETVRGVGYRLSDR